MATPITNRSYMRVEYDDIKKFSPDIIDTFEGIIYIPKKYHLQLEHMFLNSKSKKPLELVIDNHFNSIYEKDRAKNSLEIMNSLMDKVDNKINASDNPIDNEKETKRRVVIRAPYGIDYGIRQLCDMKACPGHHAIMHEGYTHVQVASEKTMYWAMCGDVKYPHNFDWVTKMISPILAGSDDVKSKIIIPKRLVRSFKNSHKVIFATDEKYMIVSHVWGPTYPIIKDIPGIDWKVPISSYSKLESVLTYFSKRSTDDVVFWWMDILCMDQDDPDDISKQVPLMGYYYSNAYETIVFCEDADNLNTEVSRLKRGGHRPNQCIHIMVEVLKLEWMSRIWTFQELVLSNIKTLVALSYNKLPETVDIAEVAGRAVTQIAEGCIDFEINDKLGSIVDGEYLLKMVVCEFADKLPEQCKYVRNIPVGSVARMVKNRYCKLQEDKIYGLLGLFRGSDHGINIVYDSSQPSFIRVNNTTLEAVELLNNISIRNGDSSVIYTNANSTLNKNWMCSFNIFETYSTVDDIIDTSYNCSPLKCEGITITDEGLDIDCMYIGLTGNSMCVKLYGHGIMEENWNFLNDLSNEIIKNNFSLHLLMDVILNGICLNGFASYTTTPGRLKWDEEFSEYNNLIWDWLCIVSNNMLPYQVFDNYTCSKLGGFIMKSMNLPLIHNGYITFIEVVDNTDTMCILIGNTDISNLKVITYNPQIGKMWTPCIFVEENVSTFCKKFVGLAFLREHNKYANGIFTLTA